MYGFLGKMSPDQMMINSDFGEPILFRTTSAEICKLTLDTGSLWLRSAEYYQRIEDQARRDSAEGLSAGRNTVPFRVQCADGVVMEIRGDGLVGQRIVPHYILSLHGSSISRNQLRSFGAFTFGIKNLFKLTMEVFHEASRIIDCTGVRYGPISYRYTALTQTRAPIGGAVIQLTDNPPHYLNPVDTDVLRKLPIAPFVEQDEWRIAVFTNGHVDGDPDAPLRINVRPSHFYPYEFTK